MITLTPHQNCAVEALQKDISILCAGTGAGKTATLIASILKKGLYPVLVVAPIRAITTAWLKDIEKVEYDGQRIRRYKDLSKGVRGFPEGTIDQVHFINPEKLKSFATQQVPQYKGLIIDELTLFKTVTNRQKKTRTTWLLRITQQAHWRVGATATLLSESLLTLQPMFYALDRGRLYGESYMKFQQKYFHQKPFNRYKWFPYDWTKHHLKEVLRMSGYIVTMDGQENTDCRKVAVPITLSDEITREMKKFQKEMQQHSKAVYLDKLRQFTQGFYYKADAYGNTETIFVEPSKKRVLLNLLERHPRAVISYNYQAERDYLLALLKEKGKDVVIFNDKRKTQWKTDYILIHPKSAGHGVDGLQNHHNILIFHSCCWGRESFDQTVGRINRQGQNKPVTVYIMYCKGTRDQDTIEKMKKYAQHNTRFMDGL